VNRDGSVEESTVTEQSGGGGGRKKRKEVSSEDESSKLVSTSSANDLLVRLSRFHSLAFVLLLLSLFGSRENGGKRKIFLFVFMVFG
jgi:hypothetical protein